MQSILDEYSAFATKLQISKLQNMMHQESTFILFDGPGALEMKVN